MKVLLSQGVLAWQPKFIYKQFVLWNNNNSPKDFKVCCCTATLTGDKHWKMNAWQTWRRI